MEKPAEATMRLIEYATHTPEENIAMDELLLQKAEAGRMGETLRFWEAEEHFVVVGRACKVREDCLEEKCTRDAVKILRRISGGGTVLQGPGCVNYSAVLFYESDKGYSSIRSSYRNILGKMSEVMRARGLNVTFYPTSDLTLDGRKISGNAQARKRKYFLHHGTFLYDFDLERVSSYLKHPGKEPEYRKGRTHKNFLTNIPISREDLMGLVKEVFSCREDILEIRKDDLRVLNRLIADKYSSDRWNHAF
jgi:lipoate-protein ligase A